MNNFYFFIKSILIGVGISAVVGAIVGFVSSLIHADHAHQILPKWLIVMVLGSMIGAISSVVVAVYMTYFGKQNLTFVALITSLVAAIVLVIVATIYL